MLVIVVENAPDRLIGYLSRWLLEVRTGVFVGDYSVKVRNALWDTTKVEIGNGNAVIAWSAANDSGFDFQTWGKNRRTPAELDGLKLVKFTPIEEEEILVKI